MDRLNNVTALYRSSEHNRTESADSGIHGMAAQAADINLPMQSCDSDLVCSSQAESNIQISTISEQTILLMQKMQILDMKLQSMESQLKNEQLQRLALEAKVVKLEEDNEQLTSVQIKAGKELQSFAEMFYAETELMKARGSCNISPYPSLAELRRKSRARTNSLSSNSSGNTGSRLSNVST